MSYIVGPVRVPITEEIENTLFENDILIAGISIENRFLRKPYRTVAYYLQGLGHLNINKNFQQLRSGIESACKKLEDKDPNKYDGKKMLYELLERPLKHGTFKEFEQTKTAEMKL
jgi:hypothetical protein